MSVRFASSLLLVLLVHAAHAQEPSSVAAQARSILKTYCHRCHHGEGSEGGASDVLSPKTLTTAADGEKPLLVVGKPDASKFWLRAGVKKNMPPKDETLRPSDAELAVIKKWIEIGAPEAPAETEKRRFISVESTLKTLRDHLQNTDPEDRPYLRFFSLVHLHNNPHLLGSDLDVHRAALSKAINSLSWKARIVVPEVVDKEQTLLAIDLRDLDWDRLQHWKSLMAAYPYGLTYKDRDELRKLDADVRELADCSIPVLRLDWFVAVATRPPLYHVLLELPTHAGTLEKQLKVDVADNFRRNRLDRAAFRKSGVSEQNRLIERHDALYGAYWKSYDFKRDEPSSSGRSDLTEFPLGPRFVRHPYPQQAFEHDGGEIIFNLPNGLQAYLLVDGKDQRIDAGPIEVVSDAQKTSGTNVIVNGLSCMACHSNGMIAPPADVVREGTGVQGLMRRKVQRLYPTSERMKALLAEDVERFGRAVDKATAPFLKERKVRDLPAEPIGEVARRYARFHLDLGTAAAELGLEKADELKGLIRGSKRLRDMGLQPLLKDGGVLERMRWEQGAFSLMQRVARELELGSPARELAP